MLRRFESGEIGPDEWRAFRLLRGTYGQRQAGDAQMLRVKIPQGILASAQLDALADVAERYSRGFGHITTRQNIQFHFVKLHDVEPAMRHLADAGLTTREACGNSVRNITACPYAGVAADEPFDVTPYAEALTRYLLRHPLSSSLPRKFKIAFEGCTARSHRHGDQRHRLDGARRQRRTASARRGFRVTVAGGTATMTRAGHELFEFLPAGEMFNVAEAIIRVFHRLGDYKHKQRNRLKFLVKSLGLGRLRSRSSSASSRRSAPRAARALPFDPEQPPVEEAAADVGRARAAVVDEILRAATSTPVIGPGHRAAGRAAPDSTPQEFATGRATNVRRAEAGRDGRWSRSRRCSATSRRRRCGSSASWPRPTATARSA